MAGTSSKDLIKQILKSTKSDYADMLMTSKLLDKSDLTVTDIPAVNVALSGRVDGGFDSGVISIAGKSKHFKTLFALNMASSYLHKHEDAVLVFLDSEFGSPRDYFHMFKDGAKDRIIHIPVTTVENLRTEMVNLLKDMTRDQKVIFIVDSIGNLSSEKENADAESGKQTVDMTRAKALKSLFRIVTPQLKLKDKTLIAINHTYQTLEMFSKEVLSGGTGGVYNSDTIFIIGKQQEKEGTEIVGWNFVINIEKSRFVKEKSKLVVLVTYDANIYKYSNIFELGVEFGMIENPSKGYYAWKTPEGEEPKKLRRNKIETDEIMEELLADEKFKQLVESKYIL